MRICQFEFSKVYTNTYQICCSESCHEPHNKSEYIYIVTKAKLKPHVNISDCLPFWAFREEFWRTEDEAATPGE